MTYEIVGLSSFKVQQLLHLLHNCKAMSSTSTKKCINIKDIQLCGVVGGHLENISSPQPVGKWLQEVSGCCLVKLVTNRQTVLQQKPPRDNFDCLLCSPVVCMEDADLQTLINYTRFRASLPTYQRLSTFKVKMAFFEMW